MELSAEKKHLRMLLRQMRNALTPEAVEEGSARVLGHLEALEAFQRAERIFTYLAHGKEVDTQPLIIRLLAAGRPVYAPRRAGPGKLQWVQLGEQTAFVRIPPGILEPEGDAAEAVFSVRDVALVPGLAFTREGVRLGQGGGYYDRFLAVFPGLKIGLCLDFQLLAQLPEEAHDQRLDLVITPRSLTRAERKQ